jgi:hypothetical protein
VSTLRPAPRRFVDASGPTGELLRRALANPAPSRPLPRFVDLRERRARRLRFYRVGGALTAASLTLLALLALRVATNADATPAIGAERFAATSGSDRSHAAAVAVAAAEQPAASASLTSVPASSGVVVADKPKQRTVSATPQPSSRPPSVTESDAPAGAETAGLGTAKTCAQIARSGAAEEAITCYEKLAAGSGVSAELALFEQARLAGKVLHQPERALLTLASYRKRFPRGALRAEVMLAQIDWLVTSGQSARALPLVEEALRSGLLQERASELEQVRDRLQREAAARQPR